MAKKTLGKTVSPKDTKQTIWEAYQQLLTQEPQEQSLTSLVKKEVSLTQDLKQTFANSTNTLVETLNDAIVELIKQFENATLTLEEIKKAHEAKKRFFQLEQEERQVKIKRDEEEYVYELAKRRKQDEDELKEFITKQESEIEQRKKALKEQEDEILTLRTKTKDFEEVLEKSQKEVASKITNELTNKFTQEKLLREQEAKAKEELAIQKIESLTQIIKSQDEQTKRLQQSLESASQQLTRIAERAVEKGTLSSTSNLK